MTTSLGTLQFFGGAGTVTGSKYLVKVGRRQVLLEAGLFQGLKDLRLRNWGNPPFKVSMLDAVVLSHAHIDHSGYAPKLVRAGFRGKIFCTSGTADLLRIMLPDAARLQEEEAAWANKEGFSKHRPALPLYTVEDARATLRRLRPCVYGRRIDVADDIGIVFRRAGHILGSASVEAQLGKARRFRLVFSGDLGRWNYPVLRDPEFAPEADTLLLESTYGDRFHPTDPSATLARVVNESVKRGGILIIPSFAVGRTQVVVWLLRFLEDAKKIPSLPVYVDSPMAIDVSDIYCRHVEDHDLDERMSDNGCLVCCQKYHLSRTTEESKRLNRLAGPAIIIAGSGMATGGRVLHHLKHRLPDPRTTVLFVGFQAAGTRGRALQEGARFVKMHGQEMRVRATIETVDGLSAHADQREILRWLSGFRARPKQTYLVHGEPSAAAKLAAVIKAKLGWKVRPAVDGETVALG